MRDENEVLYHFIKWAESNELIRTAIMTSSRASKLASIDFLSDYDIELSVLLGYNYPIEVDTKVMEFCQRIMTTEQVN